MKKQERFIDILMAANKNKLLQVEIEIPYGDKSKKAFLRTPDAWSIWEEQDLKRRHALNKAVKEGLRGVEIDQAEWEKELAQYKDEDTRARMAIDPPSDQAEQYARKVAGLRTIIDLIPRYLRDEDGSLLFPSHDEQNLFVEILTNDTELMNAILAKYVELTTKIKDTGTEIKNESKPDGQNGNSKIE